MGNPEPMTGNWQIIALGPEFSSDLDMVALIERYQPDSADELE